MKFIALSVLISAVAGLAIRAENGSSFDPALPINILTDVQPTSLPPKEGAPGAIVGKRDAVVRENSSPIDKRNFLYIYVCQDNDFLGICQSLGTTTGNCYNLGNGFDDSISSLSVPSGYTCVFYNNINCNTNQGTLTVYGAYSISATGDYGFNDNISSYYCY